MWLASWLFVVIIYFPVLRQLYLSRWENVDYTHAYFILPISLWLAWRMRQKLRTAAQKGTTRKSAMSGLLFLFGGLFLLVLGRRHDYLMVSTLSIVPVLFGLSVYLYGPGLAKPLSFPVLYLLLMVPPPLGILDGLTLPMRHWNTMAAESILKLFGYPVLRNGLTLYLSGNEIFIGPACSGFRSLITMISISAVYIHLSKASRLTKSVLAACVIPLALLGNLLRVLGICTAAHSLGLEWAERVHTVSGYVVFLSLILAMKGLDGYLEKKISYQRP